MRRKILIFVFISMLITVILSCAILALFNMRNTLAYAKVQQNFQVQSTISAINIGLSEGLIPFIDTTFNNVANNQGFVGGVVFDSDMGKIRAFPERYTLQESLQNDFKLEQFNEQAELTKSLEVESAAYTLAKLIDDEGDIIGYLFLSFDNSIIQKAAQQSLLQALGIVAMVSIVLLVIVAYCMTVMIRPLLSLIDFVHEVTDKKNFSLRIKHNHPSFIARALRLESAEINGARTASNEMVNMVEKLLLQLDKARREIDDILNSIEQGIFTFNIDQSINSEHSAKAEELFDTTDFEKAKIQHLFDLKDQQMKEFDNWLALCSTNPKALKQWQLYSRLCPALELHRPGDPISIIELKYRPIIENNKLDKVMVLARDITKERAAEKALIKSRQEQEALMGRVLALINCSGEEIKDYVDYAIAEMERLNNCSDLKELIDHSELLFRNVHTLKGHAGTLGFDYFAEKLSSLESFLGKIKKSNPKDTLEELEFSEWANSLSNAQIEHIHIIEMKDKIFRRQSGDRISIDKQLFKNFQEKLQGNVNLSHDQMIVMLNQLEMQTFDSYCQKYRNLIKRFSVSLDKEIDPLVVETPNALIHRVELKRIDDAMVHIIRNAIDHGIEDEETRFNLHKGPGKISIALHSEDNSNVLTIKDDGAGLDPKKFASIAIEKQLISSEACDALSDQDKINLIFIPGFTSKSEITELSGRGVGMDAVSDIMKELEGDISLNSDLGVGTAFTLTFPSQHQNTGAQVRH